jgi:hypothetical protein
MIAVDASPAAAGGQSLCFVTSIESGVLEELTLRMAESVRRFGGRLSESPMLAVKPRNGPPIARATRRRFDDLGVEFVSLRSQRRFAWFHYLNKPLTMLAAEERSDADILVWVDADALVVGEPSAFLLADDVDIAAGPTDVGVIGTTGPDSRYEPYWRNLCAVLGLDLEDLPWVDPYVGEAPIRFYVNAGIFAYRRSTHFAADWLENCLTALRARAGFPDCGETRIEQASLGLTILERRLRWAPLPHGHNLALASYLADQFDAKAFREARLLHYHDSMEPHYWPIFLGLLERHHPESAQWLAERGPVLNPAPRSWRATAEAFRIFRGLPRRVYRARMVHPNPA